MLNLFGFLLERFSFVTFTYAFQTEETKIILKLEFQSVRQILFEDLFVRNTARVTSIVE